MEVAWLNCHSTCLWPSATGPSTVPGISSTPAEVHTCLCPGLPSHIPSYRRSFSGAPESMKQDPTDKGQMQKKKHKTGTLAQSTKKSYSTVKYTEKNRKRNVFPPISRGVRHAKSAAYLSQSNGRAEVAGRQLFERLRKIHLCTSAGIGSRRCGQPSRPITTLPHRVGCRFTRSSLNGTPLGVEGGPTFVHRWNGNGCEGVLQAPRDDGA